MSRNKAEQLNEQGLEQLKDGQVEKALETFSQAISEDESFAFPYCHIGNILSAANHPEDAITWFDKTIQIDPKIATAYYGKGSALYNLEKWDDAIHMYQQAEAQGLENSDLYYMMGLSYKNKGEGNERQALGCFSRAVELNAEDSDAIFERGMCFAFLGHLDEAKADFYQVIEHDEHADAHYNLGVAYAYEGNTAQALEHIERAIEIQPDHLLAHNAKKQLKGE